ncbi:TonB-dependent receptor [Alteromonas sp. RW2A1]|nr:TonB-dependent receptor [Alteromonas sp. RW2A1]
MKWSILTLAIASAMSYSATANTSAEADSSEVSGSEMNSTEMNGSDIDSSEIENIEVRGSYIEGYGAHKASGASRINLPIKDIPQSVSVITSAQFDDYQLNGINDVLDTATGVNVQRVETSRTYYSARGFDINNFQIDGIGLPLIRGNNHGDEDSAIYERIEIIRGANGLMTGVGNPSATVNFIRKRPGMQNGLTVQGLVGSWDNRRIEVDGTYRVNEDFGIRGVAVSQSQESYLDRYEQERQVAYLFAEYNISDSTTFSVSHSYHTNNADGNNWGANPLFYSDGTATNFDVSTSTSADWSYWDVEKHNTLVELDHVFANNWYMRATYSRKVTDEDSELFYVFGTPNRETGLGLTGYASEYDHDEETDLIDVYLTGDFNLFGRSHEFVVGVNHASMTFEDMSLYDFTTGNGFPAMPPLETWDGNAPIPTLVDGLTGADVDTEQSAVYFTTRFSLTDDLHVTAGGRQNRWDTSGLSYDVAQDAEDSEFIPYVGVVYALNDSISAYASYTETFLSQTELDINNNTLAPIVGESKEVGFKSEFFEDRLIATVAYFDIVQENLAIPDPATADLPPGEQRFIGATGIESSGYEFEVAGELLPGLQTSIGYTDFTIDGNELVADYTPERLLKFAATYTPASFDKLSVGVNARWQDDTSRVQGVVGEGFANAGDTIVTRQDAYAIIDLMARYRVSDNFSVALNANNVTDEKYINSLYWAQGFYGAPASYMLSATWSL